MVPLSPKAAAIAQNIPIKISPLPPGHWRWVGTKTLLFEPDGRFPMATEYVVEIPAGIKSSMGSALATAKSWKFRTPAPRVEGWHPGSGPQRRDPLMLVAFDQKIDPDTVIRSIRVSSDKMTWKVRLAKNEEVEADRMAGYFVKDFPKENWVAFRLADPQKPFPPDSVINVSIDQGAASAEGPLKTEKPQSHSFKTYGLLAVVEQRCGWDRQGRSCSPTEPWVINFSNSLDAKKFDSSQVQVEPGISQMKVESHGRELRLMGIKRAHTQYRLTLKGSIGDDFGQTLGEDKSLTFNVEPSQPRLFASNFGFVVLDPYAEPRYSVYSINHASLKVRLYTVGPEHWDELPDLIQGRKTEIPGHLVLSKTVEVKAIQPDEPTETQIDLSPALNDGSGQVLVVVEPAAPSPAPVTGRRIDRVVTWAQVTQIGLDASYDGRAFLAWATSLKDGKPLEGVDISLYRKDIHGTTEASGLARLPLRNSNPESLQWLLVARKGHDTAILPDQTSWWRRGRLAGRFFGRASMNSHDDLSSIREKLSLAAMSAAQDKMAAEDSLRWFVFDDRHLYRPGEKVHVKGWVRVVGGGPEGDVGFVENAVKSTSYTLTDSRGDEILKGKCRIDALGGFDTVLQLPSDMSLGIASLAFEAEGGHGTNRERQYSHDFHVEEFRRPEFEVSTTVSEGPHFAGDHAEAAATASYYAGGPLPDAPVYWSVSLSSATFVPPNRGDFTFGRWVPWWKRMPATGVEKVEDFRGKTDGAGKHGLRMDFLSTATPAPVSVTAEARIRDVNRQEWSASSTILVHPANLYVGVRSPRTFVEKGQPLVVQSIVTDLDGKAVEGRKVLIRATLFDRVLEKGEWHEKETNPRECEIRSASEPVECRFETKEGGSYRIVATVEDDSKRKSQSELTLWVAGGKSIPSREVEQEDITLIPDRKEYQPGDTAELLVQAPFAPAEGLLTLRRGGIAQSERFHMDQPSHVLKVSMKEGFLPNLHVQVDLVGASVRADDAGNPDERLPKRPAYATGSANLSISPASRKLSVQATPRATILEPGSKTIVDIEVKDSSGKPVKGSEVALVVADEAVLALTDYRIVDPLGIFYPERDPGTSDHTLREIVMLANPESFITKGKGGPDQRALAFMSESFVGPLSRGSEEEALFMKHMKDGGHDEISLRKDFNALATFVPSLKTDANGRTQVEVKLPDSLTRYRVTGVAVAGDKRFGLGESAITARLPLMVRPSAPRFLNFGDKLELPAVVQNQTDSPLEVDVAVRASNAELTDGEGRRLRVPAGDRVEVRFPASAALPGTARFQFAVVSGKWADAAEIALPVRTPATTEAFATYGEVDKGLMAQPIEAPPGVVREFGGLEIETSSTQLQALTDSLLYLVSYPFECAEQLSSRVLAVAALRDVLTAFKATGLPAPETMTGAVERDIKRLYGIQKSDGGFGFWESDTGSLPYVSIHAAHALQRAKDKGFAVPEEMLENASRYLNGIERHISSTYGTDAKRALVAYSLYVRSLMGDRDTEKARQLVAESSLDGPVHDGSVRDGSVHDGLSVEAAGWLLSVLAGDSGSTAEIAAIRRYLDNHVSEEAGTAHFASSYGADGGHLLLHSERRADAIVLEALIADQPKSDLISKIVRGLLAHRKQGRWESTQENAFVLLALDKYFATYEKATPKFAVRAWLGNAFAGAHEFRGHTTDRHELRVPMHFLTDSREPRRLLLQKEGVGRLYYRLGLRYAPSSLKLEHMDCGFSVERTYEPVDNKEDVRRDADGTWQIKAGARVRVRLTMLAPTRRYHVALVDPLPAGFEALNPALSTTPSIPEDEENSGNPSQKRSWWWSRSWFEHQNLRDDRVEAFTSLLWDGVHTYTYVARATTPGDFIAPPSKAEEMYHPETFGRGTTDRVVVK